VRFGLPGMPGEYSSPDGTPAAVACTAGPGLTLAVAEG
jgi:hypothetical protein